LSWPDFLEWLVTPTAIPVALGIISSVLAEYFPQFKALAPRYKRLVFLGFSLLVPVAGTALGIQTLGWPNVWEPTWWQAVQAGVVAFAAGWAVNDTRKLKA
jgi:hypothetical protein